MTLQEGARTRGPDGIGLGAGSGAHCSTTRRRGGSGRRPVLADPRCGPPSTPCYPLRHRLPHNDGALLGQELGKLRNRRRRRSHGCERNGDAHGCPGCAVRSRRTARVGCKREANMGQFTLWAQTRCTAENAQRKARRRRRVENPARLCNAAMGVFGSNPKGTGGLGRHSTLFSSRRRPVFALSAALIGTPGHPFAFASIV
jgi:hypothetical protein